MEKTDGFKVMRIHKLNTGGKVAAFADVSVNDELLIRGLRIVNGKKGMFVTMPQEKGKDDRWYSIVECLSETSRKTITQLVLEAYRDQ
jgi:stage V sporulation protein G